MCGRVYQSYNLNQLLRIAGTKLIKNPQKYEPSYNVAPTNYLATIKQDGKNRVLDIAKWGYESPFQVFIINARAEEIQTKPTFIPLMDSRRCLVIVQGYFEWNQRREPYVFKPVSQKDKTLEYFLIPALYTFDECIILLTTDAVGDLRHLHPRMPVIVDEKEAEMWLNSDNYRFQDLQDIILNREAEKWRKITFYQLAPYVNDVTIKSQDVLMKFGDYKDKVEGAGIKKYFSPAKNKKWGNLKRTGGSGKNKSQSQGEKVHESDSPDDIVQMKLVREDSKEKVVGEFIGKEIKVVSPSKNNSQKKENSPLIPRKKVVQTKKSFNYDKELFNNGKVKIVLRERNHDDDDCNKLFNIPTNPNLKKRKEISRGGDIETDPKLKQLKLDKK